MLICNISLISVKEKKETRNEKLMFTEWLLKKLLKSKINNPETNPLKEEEEELRER